MADKNDGPQKKTRKSQNKVRVKLPGIESYEKTLEFTAEGPGRVVVRLERLMGSDRIRITDPKYLSTLVERLEAEEAQSWGSRSRLRKKAEKNRSRQLAIEGLMEPTEDMQDLYEHPVFRVNRVLNRLAVFDHNMGTRATEKIPPIVPVEPFADDESGKIFTTYSQHQIFHREVLPYDDPEYVSRRIHKSRGDLSRGSNIRPSTVSIISHPSPMSQPSPRSRSKSVVVATAKSTKSLYRAGESASAEASVKPSEINLSAKSSTGIAKETEGEEEDEEEEGDGDQKIPGKGESLQDFKVRYGVPSEANLVRDWQAFRSHLVERVYEDIGGSAEELYTLAGHVIGTYDRQLATVDDFVESRDDKVKEERAAMGLPNEEELKEDGEGEIEEEDEGEENEEEEGDATSKLGENRLDKEEDDAGEEDEAENAEEEVDEAEEDTEAIDGEEDEENAEE